jgi:Cu/Ag efflux protein CusF
LEYSLKKNAIHLAVATLSLIAAPAFASTPVGHAHTTPSALGTATLSSSVHTIPSASGTTLLSSDVHKTTYVKSITVQKDVVWTGWKVVRKANGECEKITVNHLTFKKVETINLPTFERTVQSIPCPDVASAH